MSTLFKKMLVLCSVTAVLFTACSKRKNEVIKEPEVSLDLKLAASASFGNVLTDGTGKTLYCFVKDANSTSVCVDGCLVTWPVYYAANGNPPSGLDATDIATLQGLMEKNKPPIKDGHCIIMEEIKLKTRSKEMV